MEIVVVIICVGILAVAYTMLFATGNAAPAGTAEPAETKTDIQV